VDEPGEARVAATEAALEAIRRLQGQRGPIMFFQSGGCCDGSLPMWQWETWKHTRLILDVALACLGRRRSSLVPLMWRPSYATPDITGSPRCDPSFEGDGKTAITL
jgi:hypothetical protein